MVKKTIFREYDIRGIVHQELHEESVTKIGYCFGKKVHNTNKNTYIAIGYDARTHSEELLRYLANGLTQAGCTVLNMGMVATGVNYFSNFISHNINNETVTITASIMITGSHNPSEYNGFKFTLHQKPFFGEDIYQLQKEVEKTQNLPNKKASKYLDIDIKSYYINYITEHFEHLKNLEGKYIFDCGNGVANTVLESILERLNINHTILFGKPDGTFPNHHPDPSERKNLESIQKAMKENYTLGFAYDGDADRVILISPKQVIQGDIMAILLAQKINDPVVVGEVKCSQVMYDTINQYGQTIMHKTGHSNIKAKVIESKADLGVEVGGHLFFNDRYFGYDDGIYATLRLLELHKEGYNIDKEIEQLPQYYSSDEMKFSTTEEEKFEIIHKLKSIILTPPIDFPKIFDIITVDGLRIILEEGWILVRASNTTPVIVTRCEAKSQQLLEHYQNHLEALITKAKNELNGTTNPDN